MDPFDRLGKEGLEWTQRGPAQPNEDDFPRLTTYTTGKFVDMATSQARHWRTAAQALALVRRRDSLTRTELTSLLGLRSGPISDLVKRLVLARLIEEAPAAIEGPGRPTSTLHAHPNGPVAIVLDLRHGDWRLGVCELDGSVHITAHGAHDISNPPMLLDTIASHFKTLTTSLGSRAIGVGVAVPGIVMDGRANMTMRRWPDIDMSPLVNATSLPFVLRNDATLAGMAEARRHPVELNSLLHIVVEVGVGGAFVVDGQPVPSAHGLHGEFGHLPFGNPEVECACGARGCWTIAFDIPEITRRTGLEPGDDPRAWLHTIFTNADKSETIQELRASLAASLGRGIAGLVNALDPALVTLGGLANDVRHASPTSFEQSFDTGLMRDHRAAPPPVTPAQAGELATMVGAGLSVFDEIFDAEFLARWASQ